MERADLGARGFVRADGARGDEKASAAGWGSFFHVEDRGRKRSPARRDKLSRRVRQKWSRRDGTLTIDIRGVDPPTRVPPVSVDPLSGDTGPAIGTGQVVVRSRARPVCGVFPPAWDGTGLIWDGTGQVVSPRKPRRNGPLTPRPSPARGEGGRCGWGLGILGLRCAPTQAISCRAPLGPEKNGTGLGTGHVVSSSVSRQIRPPAPNRLPPTDGGPAPARGGFVPPYGIADERR